MPKLSVIMSVYNTAKYLYRSINSVLNQSMKDIELVLVDDGSTDNSGAICDAFSSQDPRIITIHKQNEGAGPARNLGIEKATGDFIAFPDSDDWLDNDTYEYCLGKMGLKAVDLLIFGSVNTYYNDNGSVVSEINDNINYLYLSSQKQCRENWIKLLQKNIPLDGPSNKIYKKSIIDKYNIRFPAMRRMQDGVFNILYYDKINSLLTVDKHFYHFTCSDPMTHKKKLKNDILECIIKYDIAAVDMFKSWNMFDVETKEILSLNFMDKIDQILFYHNNSFTEIQRIIYHEYIQYKIHSLQDLQHKYTKREWAVYHKMTLLIYLYCKFYIQ